MIKISNVLLLSFLLLTACAEKPACTDLKEDRQYLTQDELSSLDSQPVATEPTEVSIAGRNMMVDKLVTGPLCNDKWQGTVYVGCDVQVMEWSETPLFLKGCDLSIEPGTVVYVAAHNDAAYYNGCSCHTGELP